MIIKIVLSFKLHEAGRKATPPTTDLILNTCSQLPCMQLLSIAQIGASEALISRDPSLETRRVTTLQVRLFTNQSDMLFTFVTRFCLIKKR